jgi:antitoxin ParD1/3/4
MLNHFVPLRGKEFFSRLLERFVTDAVAQGRYRDVTEVIAAGVSLLKRVEAAQTEFNASLGEAEAESELLGFVTADDLHAEMIGVINKARRAINPAGHDSLKHLVARRTNAVNPDQHSR